MRQDGRPRTPGLVRSSGVGAIIALAKETRAVNGRVFVDTFDGSTGAEYNSVPLVTWGGGSSGTSSNTPIEIRPIDGQDPTQVVLLFLGRSVRPVCLGTLSYLKGFYEDEVERRDATQVHTSKVSKDDWHWQKGGSQWVLDKHGDALLDLVDGGLYRIQLRGAGLVQLSRDEIGRAHV